VKERVLRLDGELRAFSTEVLALLDEEAGEIEEVSSVIALWFVINSKLTEDLLKASEVIGQALEEVARTMEGLAVVA